MLLMESCLASVLFIFLEKHLIDRALLGVSRYSLEGYKSFVCFCNIFYHLKFLFKETRI